MNNLVVVESPAKSKTVARYLAEISRRSNSGNGKFEILATGGHILESDGVDIESNFRLNYKVIPEKKQYVDRIVRAMHTSDALYLATDPDREGEAISAHVQDVLEGKGVLKGKPVHRIVFHEVTADAVRNAIDNPGKISENLVQAQQSRDALDILVGFNLSPLLIRKLATNHLSAGRVQSPALRLIVERQREIDRFEAKEYWTIAAELFKDRLFLAELTHRDGIRIDKFYIADQESATQIVAQIEAELAPNESDREIEILRVEQKTRARRPYPPFTTSTLVQDASRKLGMSAKATAMTAQRLYEGLPINGTQTGLITYTRTDSVALANSAVQQIREYIASSLVGSSVPEKARFYKTKSKNAQEAHEAIRVTNVSLTPEKVKGSLNQNQFRLYDLIWRRTLACQMKDAIYDDVLVDFGTENYTFRATGSTMREAGWLEIYRDDAPDKKNGGNSRTLPSLHKGEYIQVKAIRPEQHFTQPPPRYNQGSLVKKLEEYGIGRPSTWPTIITKLLDRNYVELVNQKFIAKSLGCIVVDFLTEHFDRYLDYEFTSNLEDGLDEVARGEKKRIELLSEFWTEFEARIKEKSAVSRYEIPLGTDPESGREVIVRVRDGGSFIQVGRKDDGHDRPIFRSLAAEQDPSTVTLDVAKSMIDKPSLPRTLGTIEGDREVIVSTGRFGPYLKITAADSNVSYCNLDENLDLLSITIEDIPAILAQPRLPRSLGTTPSGDLIEARKGRFGSYLSIVSADQSKFSVNLGELNPMTVTLQEAVALIDEKKKNPSKRQKQILKIFDDSSIQVLGGRYGPYVTDGKTNASVPRNLVADELDLETCKDLIAKKKAAPKRTVRKRTPRNSRS